MFLCVCSGIGLALCERLLTEDSHVRLCLACRNLERAGAARAALLASHSTACVELLKLDVGSMQSVLSAAEEIKSRLVSKVNFLESATELGGPLTPKCVSAGTTVSILCI